MAGMIAAAGVSLFAEQNERNSMGGATSVYLPNVCRFSACCFLLVLF